MIVMEIQSADVAELEGATTDEQWKRIVVVFNASPEKYSGRWPKGVTFFWSMKKPVEEL